MSPSTAAQSLGTREASAMRLSLRMERLKRLTSSPITPVSTVCIFPTIILVARSLLTSWNVVSAAEKVLG